MNVFAINLDERVIPFVPIRQFVVSVPIPLRHWMVADHELTLEINRIIIRTIRVLLRKKARRTGIHDGITGAVTFIQRFGSALNLNPYFHVLVPDGIYQRTDTGLRFHEAPALLDADVTHLVERICRNVTKHLIRSGYLEELTLEADPDRQDSLNEDLTALSVCQLASVSNRVAFGFRRGQWVRRIGAGQFGYGQGGTLITGKLCARHGGFSIHAATTVEDLDRERLRNLIAYVARPAVALNRLSWTESGDVGVASKTPWSDGTTGVVLSPTEPIEKLAALVPYPHKNLMIYSGCFAPNHSLRRFIVPVAPHEPPTESNPDESDHTDPTAEAEEEHSRYIPWAELLKRTWDVDIFTCRKCGEPTVV